MKLIKELVIIFCIFIVGNWAKRKRIIGGTKAAISDFPHLVSFRTLYNKHFCSGSIVSRLHILSAAHCFTYFNHQYYRIKVYTGTSSSTSTSGDVHEINNIIIHPLFVWKSKDLQNPHDIGIVTLKSEIQFNSLQKKINLPTRDVFDDNLGVLAGWGISHVDYTMISDRLLKIPATLFNYISCAAEIPVIVYENQFCSVHSSNTTGPCPVDSGGSVVSNGELYGIISMTEYCVNGSPAVHTKVYSYLNFIRPILKQNLND